MRGSFFGFDGGNERQEMFESWLLNTLSVLLATIAALLVFLAHRQLPALAGSLSSDEKLRFAKQHRRITIALALLGAWLVVQCLPLVWP